jgi:FkbM family methyltransferase
MPGPQNTNVSDPGPSARLAEIERRVTALERALAGRLPNSTPEWAEPRWYESPVQLALAKLLRLGDLGFDVGANLGIISAMMGAAVGPYGRVVAFEASPRTLGQLHVNLNNSNAFNVTVVHAAVAETSGEFLPIFYGNDTPADTIMKRDEREPDAVVRSLALDDYVERLGSAPRVVKIDIEGAELLALQGFRRTLAKARPALVIETFSLDLALDELLQSLGYDLCLDVNTFAPFDKRTQTEPFLCNLLYLHKRDDRAKPFRSVGRSALAQYAAGDLATEPKDFFWIWVSCRRASMCFISIMRRRLRKSKTVPSCGSNRRAGRIRCIWRRCGTLRSVIVRYPSSWRGRCRFRHVSSRSRPSASGRCCPRSGSNGWTCDRGRRAWPVSAVMEKKTEGRRRQMELIHSAQEGLTEEQELAAISRQIEGVTSRIRTKLEGADTHGRLRYAWILSRFLSTLRKDIDPLLFAPLPYGPGYDFEWLRLHAHRQTLAFYTEICGVVFEEVRKLRQKHVRILDVGSGSGIGTQLLAVLLNTLTSSKPEIVANDYAENYAPYAHAYFDDIQFISGPVQSKIKDKFDIVICSHLVEHFEDPFPFIEELRGLAKHALILYAPFQESPLSKGHFHSFTAADLVRMEARSHQIITSKGYSSDCFVAVLEGFQARTLRKAEECVTAGSFAEAVEILAGPEAPDTARAKYLLGFSLHRLGRHDEAEAHVQQAIKEGFDPLYPNLILAYCRHALGDAASAAKFLEQCDAIQADHPAVLAAKKLFVV